MVLSISPSLTYVEMLEENFGQGVPKVSRAQDGLYYDHSVVLGVDHEVPAGKW